MGIYGPSPTLASCGCSGAGLGQVEGDVPQAVPLLSDLLQVLVQDAQAALLLLGRQPQLLDLAAQAGALHAAAERAQPPRRLVQHAVEALQGHAPVWVKASGGEGREKTGSWR